MSLYCSYNISYSCDGCHDYISHYSTVVTEVRGNLAENSHKQKTIILLGITADGNTDLELFA